MLIGEQAPVLARIVLQSRLRLVSVELFLQFGRRRFVSGLERAFAVPVVAGVVAVPELVIDGQSELAFPERAVCAFRVGRRSWHPSEVRQYVFSRSNCCQSAALWARITAVEYSVSSHVRL